MDTGAIIQSICIWMIPLLLAITLHEAAHGWCAYKLGDPTAKLLGRLTINPVPHIDPIGTIGLPLLLGLISNFKFMFGFAKPVPVTPENFKNRRRDMILVSLAGPAANFIMAIAWAGIFKLVVIFQQPDNQVLNFLSLTSQIGITINLILIGLNLLPIPPLDGAKVVSNLIPPKYAYYYDKLEPYGFIILIVLMLTNLLQYLMYPIVNFIYQILLVLFNL